MMSTQASTAIPIVNYLVLNDGEPHLVCNRCLKCGAALLRSKKRLRILWS